MAVKEVLTLLGVVFLILGSLIVLISAIGIVRFRSVFSRMHAAAKPQSFGIACMGVGLMLTTQSKKTILVALLVIVLQYITVPISSHMLGRAAFRSGRAETDPTLIIDEYSAELKLAQKQAENLAEPIG